MSVDQYQYINAVPAYRINCSTIWLLHQDHNLADMAAMFPTTPVCYLYRVNCRKFASADMVVVLPGWEFDADAFKLWHYLACGRSLKKASLPVLDSAGDAGPWHSVNFGDVLEFRHKETDGGAHGTYAPCFVLSCIYFD